MGHKIEVPYAPETEVWYCAWTEIVHRVPCPECAGSLRVIVETAQGRFDVPCEACRSGYEDASGWLCRKYSERRPQRIVLGAPNVESDGRIYYFASGTSSGHMLYTDILFEDFNACQKKCDELNEKAERDIEADNANRCGRGRTEAARKLSYGRKEIAEAKRKLAYWEPRVKEIK